MFISKDLEKEVDIEKYRKKVQRIELDILKEFIRICDKFKLNYFLIGGGLIGAIRHGGFIPWDDDLDIAMLREDYDKFLEIASKEIDNKYFIQSYNTEDKYFDTLVRIRDKNSTGILRKDIMKNCNNGVFIEIYVYDTVPNNIILEKIQASLSNFLTTILYDYYYDIKCNSLSRKIMKLFSKIFCRIIPFSFTVKLWNKINGIFKNSNLEYANCEFSKEGIRTGRSKWKIDGLKNTIKVPFEDILINVPSNYHECLTKCYGDYMTPPSIEAQNQHHIKDVIYDPFTPYEFYNSDELKLYLQNKIV